MKAVAFALRSFKRELRSGEVLVLLAAVALAVAALTAVGFLTDRIGKAVARQANEVLAADLRLRSPDPVPDSWRDKAQEFGLQTADTQTFPSVVFAGDLSSLATIKAVSTSYPLRGNVRVSDTLFGEQRVVDNTPARGEVWADGALLARVEADVGDRLLVGELELLVTAVLTYRPDQSIGFASLAPSLLMNINDIPASGLIREGSRVGYALLVDGDETAVNSGRPARLGPVLESRRKLGACQQCRGSGAAIPVTNRSHKPVIERCCRGDVGAAIHTSTHGYGRADEESGRNTEIRYFCCNDAAVIARADGCHCRQRRGLRR